MLNISFPIQISNLIVQRITYSDPNCEFWSLNLSINKYWSSFKYILYKQTKSSFFSVNKKKISREQLCLLQPITSTVFFQILVTQKKSLIIFNNRKGKTANLHLIFFYKFPRINYTKWKTISTKSPREKQVVSLMTHQCQQVISHWRASAGCIRSSHVREKTWSYKERLREQCTFVHFLFNW